MCDNEIKELSLIYVQLHATKDLTPEQLVQLYTETKTQISKYKAEQQGKWMY